MRNNKIVEEIRFWAVIIIMWMCIITLFSSCSLSFHSKSKRKIEVDKTKETEKAAVHEQSKNDSAGQQSYGKVNTSDDEDYEKPIALPESITTETKPDGTKTTSENFYPPIYESHKKTTNKSIDTGSSKAVVSNSSSKDSLGNKSKTSAQVKGEMDSDTQTSGDIHNPITDIAIGVSALLVFICTGIWFVRRDYKNKAASTAMRDKHKMGDKA